LIWIELIFQLLTKKFFKFFQSENLNNLKNKEFFSLLFKAVELKMKNFMGVLCDMNRNNFKWILSNEHIRWKFRVII
jgi:hypothetical protein